MVKMNKRLYRSKKNKIIGGVCGGIAEYLDIDPTVIRVIYVILTVFTGFILGIIAYLLLWLIIPREPEKLPPANLKDDAVQDVQKTKEEKNAQTGYSTKQNNIDIGKALSIVIIVLGSIFVIYGILRFLVILFNGWWVTTSISWWNIFGLFYPIISIILGIILILIGLNNNK